MNQNQIKSSESSWDNNYTFGTFRKWQKIALKTALTLLCFENCSDLLWEKNCSIDLEKLWKKFEIARSLNRQRSVQFLKQNICLTCSWKFLRFYILEFRNLQEKLGKFILSEKNVIFCKCLVLPKVNTVVIIVSAWLRTHNLSQASHSNS